MGTTQPLKISRAEQIILENEEGCIAIIEKDAHGRFIKCSLSSPQQLKILSDLSALSLEDWYFLEAVGEFIRKEIK